jgi:hypothetical protein
MMRIEVFNTLKKCSGLTRNRAHDVTSCSIVPQPTTQPHTYDVPRVESLRIKEMPLSVHRYLRYEELGFHREFCEILMTELAIDVTIS